MLDERFVIHRYKSTSHAAMVAAVLLGGFILHDFFAQDVVRRDLLITLVAMAVTKLVAMVWYHFRD